MAFGTVGHGMYARLRINERAEMQGGNRSVESDPSEWDDMDTSFPELPEARASREKTARDPERSMEVDREGMVRRRDVGLQVSMDEESMRKSEDDVRTKESKNSSTGEVDPSTLSTAATRGKKKIRGLRRVKRAKFWQRLKASLDVSGSGPIRCKRCGRSHGGVCLAGTTACYRCRQEGHFARECPTKLNRARSPRTVSGGAAQPAVPALDQARTGMFTLGYADGC
ncbi:uncharacterized protein LOC122722258 [Manihot esculenta]|uniref:uncharacterized protein LOC122722258 n=1 Tax=Manihot esculenta TaxID=3983 RepID=UPI001CC651CD|nr:uncharacterized protein LOC122722258 [Manihot esculenta]